MAKNGTFVSIVNIVRLRMIISSLPLLLVKEVTKKEVEDRRLEEGTIFWVEQHAFTQ